jgi:8-oxo-dGTP pyrophosphatase MutT (NUDIX family)
MLRSRLTALQSHTCLANFYSQLERVFLAQRRYRRDRTQLPASKVEVSEESHQPHNHSRYHRVNANRPYELWNDPLLSLSY